MKKPVSIGHPERAINSSLDENLSRAKQASRSPGLVSSDTETACFASGCDFSNPSPRSKITLPDGSSDVQAPQSELGALPGQLISCGLQSRPAAEPSEDVRALLQKTDIDDDEKCKGQKGVLASTKVVGKDWTTGSEARLMEDRARLEATLASAIHGTHTAVMMLFWLVVCCFVSALIYSRAARDTSLGPKVNMEVGGIIHECERSLAPEHAADSRPMYLCIVFVVHEPASSATNATSPELTSLSFSVSAIAAASAASSHSRVQAARSASASSIAILSVASSRARSQSDASRSSAASAVSTFSSQSSVRVSLSRASAISAASARSSQSSVEAAASRASAASAASARSSQSSVQAVASRFSAAEEHSEVAAIWTSCTAAITAATGTPDMVSAIDTPACQSAAEGAKKEFASRYRDPRVQVGFALEKAASEFCVLRIVVQEVSK